MQFPPLHISNKIMILTTTQIFIDKNFKSQKHYTTTLQRLKVREDFWIKKFRTLLFPMDLIPKAIKKTTKHYQFRYLSLLYMIPSSFLQADRKPLLKLRHYIIITDVKYVKGKNCKFQNSKYSTN